MALGERGECRTLRLQGQTDRLTDTVTDRQTTNTYLCVNRGTEIEYGKERVRMRSPMSREQPYGYFTQPPSVFFQSHDIHPHM